MSLQFQPPPEDLINAYLNRRSPVQDITDATNQIYKTYSQAKDKQKEQELQKQQLASQDSTNKLAKFKALADYADPDQIPALAKQYGMDFPSSVPPTPSSGTVAGMTPVEMQNQQSIPSEHPDVNPVNNTVSPLIQAHAQATGWNPLDHPIPTSKAGLAKYKTSLETQKLQNDLQKPAKGPLQPVTHEQVLKDGSFDPTKQILVEPPADKSTSITDKENARQDKLEHDYRQSLESIRGDSSIKRTEEQRDAAITVYNRIKEVKDHGQVLNPIDYVDSLGQIYKARTGSAPSVDVLQQARQSTLKGKYGAAYTLLTGEQAPATTESIMNSLQEMSKSMGDQADKFHSGYMRNRVKPPTGLAHDRVASIDAERGMSFAEATGQNQTPGAGGWKYVGKVGK